MTYCLEIVPGYSHGQGQLGPIHVEKSKPHVRLSEGHDPMGCGLCEFVLVQSQ